MSNTTNKYSRDIIYILEYYSVPYSIKNDSNPEYQNEIYIDTFGDGTFWENPFPPYAAPLSKSFTFIDHCIGWLVSGGSNTFWYSLEY